MDTQLLTRDERKAKISKFIGDLSDRFSEMFWNVPAKIEAIRRYKPDVLEEFNKRWDELEKRCKEYLEGNIEWDGEVMNMEFTPQRQIPFPVLEIDRDVQNYGRNLFVWFVDQTKGL